jgi:membrane protein
MATSKNDAAHGRTARSPAAIPWPGWKDILKRTWQELGNDHVSVIAAGVAFYGLLALFPALTSLISIAGLVLDPAEVVAQLGEWTAGLPQTAAEIIVGQSVSVASGGGTALSLAAIGGLALALYSTAKGTKTLMEGMNVAYDEEETRGFLRLNLTALALTGLMIIALIVAVALGVVVPLIIDTLDLPRIAEKLLHLARWVMLAVIAMAGLSILYRFGPSRQDAKWRWITPGAVVAILLWIAATAGFSIYVSNFGSYNETYGALGGVIVLLTWLWMSAFIVLLGAELNAEIEHQIATDTTTGPDKPMGQRGALMADTLGEATE